MKTELKLWIPVLWLHPFINSYHVLITEVIGVNSFFSSLPPQAAELAEYSSKIALLEEAKRAKEEEAELWQDKVSFQHAIVTGMTGKVSEYTCFSQMLTGCFGFCSLHNRMFIGKNILLCICLCISFIPGEAGGGESAEDKGGAAHHDEPEHRSSCCSLLLFLLLFLGQ